MNDDRLPDDLVDFIHKRDTIFLGTSYVAPPNQEAEYPSHVGVNQRGGKVGFVRVRNDKRTVVLPDYSGMCDSYSYGGLCVDLVRRKSIHELPWKCPDYSCSRPYCP